MSGIELSGFDELEDLLHDMTISDAKESKAMRMAIEPIYREIEKNAPYQKGKLRKNISKIVRKVDLSTVGTVKLGAFYTMFQEFGTSTQKSHVGFVETSVNKTEKEAINILSHELLK